MMRVTWLLMLMLGIAGMPLAAASAAQSADSDEAQIRRLNTWEVAGLMQQNAKDLAAIWSDSFVVTNPYNKFLTKADVLKFVASGNLGFHAYDRRIEYLHVYGNTAIVAGSETVDWAGHMPLAGKTSELRFTSVWQQGDAGWQEIARHANIVSTHPAMEGTGSDKQQQVGARALSRGPSVAPAR